MSWATIRVERVPAAPVVQHPHNTTKAIWLGEVTKKEIECVSKLIPIYDNNHEGIKLHVNLL